MNIQSEAITDVAYILSDRLQGTKTKSLAQMDNWAMPDYTGQKAAYDMKNTLQNT